MDKRNTNIELLRMGLMLAIFIYHIVLHGLDYKHVGLSNFSGGELLKILITTMFAPSTYCFMFISGYYGIKFTIRRFFTLELWLISASLIVCLLKLILHFDLPIYEVFYSLLPIGTFKWWFMTYYMLIMIISPLINQGLKMLSEKQVCVILLLLMGYNIMSFFQFREDNGCTFLGLFAIYLLGRYCSSFKIEISQSTALIVWGSCFFLQLVLMLLCSMMHRVWIFRVLNYNLPFIMGMSVSIFYIVLNSATLL